ncbi:MAG: FtsH protease activity modulator HflK [Lachnospiraceae bacterium]|jgi:membrane protease subunit HflK|nr:FtsH protease activity modulator HflK [Lachnospiraceae bacterium]
MSIVRKSIWLFVAGVVFLVIVTGTVYTLDTQHAAVVTTFGVPTVIADPGIKFKIPLVQRVQKIDTTVRELAIGYNATTGQSINEESVMITSDFNFINVDFIIIYQVSDPLKYAFAAEYPITMMKNIAQNCIRSVIASYPIDAVLTVGKSEIQTNIRDMLYEKINSHDIGLLIRNVTIMDAEPPTEEIKVAFKGVEDARQNMDEFINKANEYVNAIIPEARANVDRTIREAESSRAARIAEANVEVSKFNAMYEEYTKFPEMTKKRMFYEAMELIMPHMKVVIVGDDGETQTILPLDSFMN